MWPSKGKGGGGSGEPGKTAKKKYEKLHFFYTWPILDLMRSLVNCWSPLTYAFHYMNVSRPTATTQMRMKVSKPSPAHATQSILHRIPFLPQLFLFLGLWIGSQYAGLCILRLSTISDQNTQDSFLQ